MAENHFTEADGRQLAVDLLREMRNDFYDFDKELQDRDSEDVWKHVCDLQLNREPSILSRYLQSVRSSENLSLERGFLSVISQFISTAAGDRCVMDVDEYEKHLERYVDECGNRGEERRKRKAKLSAAMRASWARRRAAKGIDK